jgi:hypothetical protein
MDLDENFEISKYTRGKSLISLRSQGPAVPRNPSSDDASTGRFIGRRSAVGGKDVREELVVGPSNVRHKFTTLHLISVVDGPEKPGVVDLAKIVTFAEDKADRVTVVETSFEHPRLKVAECQIMPELSKGIGW